MNTKPKSDENFVFKGTLIEYFLDV